MEMIALQEAKSMISFGHDYVSDVASILDPIATDICFDTLITDLVDEMVDDDFYSLEHWMLDNLEEVEEAISEYGWKGCDKKIHNAIAYAQFMVYQREALNDLPYFLREHSFDYLESKGIDEVPADFNEKLDILCNCDSYSYSGSILMETWDTFYNKLLSIATNTESKVVETYSQWLKKQQEV